jgi:hypothetical protein
MVLRACAAAVTRSAAFAQPSSRLVPVPPAELPDLARQSGDAMLLQKRSDGSTLLYMEQNQGAVQLDAPGRFDFVFSLAHDGEPASFRQDQGEAVLDLQVMVAHGYAWTRAPIPPTWNARDCTLC